ncbi:MAG: iron-containing alcohol dehydrogenase [Deltaproteobacteria bacterium]|nr:iron-containing alcohol dehydrogenase [Deltaproteobacteria bacterium]
MNLQRVYMQNNPGRLVFGPGSVKELANEIPANAIPLVVTDKGVSKSGILKKVTDVLEGAGIPHHIFDGIEPDPPVQVIEKAAALYRKHKCTMVIGVGGGSSIDGAKSTSLMVSYPGDIGEYSRGKLLPGPVAPIYAIPTTAGTGSEVTGLSIITDPINKVKMVLRGVPHLIPKCVFLDPELLAFIPPRVAAETGGDALTHAVECYVSQNTTVVTEGLALSAITLIGKYLRRFVGNPADMEAAEHMQLGCYLAGFAFSNGGLGLVHSIAHPVGAHYHLSHGAACSLYLPVVMEFNLLTCPEKFSSIATALGENVNGMTARRAAKESVKAVRELFTDIGVALTFAELGVKFKLLPKMVAEAMAAVPTQVNPRRPSEAQITNLFNAPLA